MQTGSYNIQGPAGATRASSDVLPADVSMGSPTQLILLNDWGFS